MIRKHVSLLVLCMLAAFAVACGGGNNAANGGGTGGGGSSGPDFSTPSGLLAAFKDAFETLDSAKLEACYSAEKWKEVGEKRKKEFEEFKKEGMSVTLVWNDADIKVEGDKATLRAKIKVKMKDGKEEEDGEGIEMVKIDGKWKLSR